MATRTSLKNSLIFFPLLSLALLLLSCEKETLQPVGAEQPTGKIRNTPSSAQERGGESIAVYLSDNSPECIDSLLSVPGVASAELLFGSKPGREEAERRHGLDKWYVVHLSEGAEAEAAAQALAGFGFVKSVEYNRSYSKCSDGISYQFTPADLPATKAIAPSLWNDPNFAAQWALNNTGDTSVAPTARSGADVNVPRAWTLCSGSPSVVVAIIDEAVQWDHPDLAGAMWTNPGEIPGNGVDDDGNGYVDDVYGYNFVDNEGTLDWKSDGNTGHGTHVAGTVAAVSNNSLGVCGIAGGSGKGDGARIMSCQVFNRNSGGTSFDIAKAFKYAADNGATIAQCSFGYESGDVTNDAAYEEGFSTAADAIKYFISEGGCDAVDGGTVIFAAGNDAKPMAAYPGALSYCVSVTALASDGLPAYYTNYSYGCNLAAPGGEYYTGGGSTSRSAILSTMPTEAIRALDDYGNPTDTYSATDYGYMQGTSMACPHVSGVAALALSYALKKGYHYTAEEFTSLLLSGVGELDSRLTGTKKSYKELNLSLYKGNMGTGSIDAWRLFMQMDGVPCITAEVGKAQRLDLSPYFGGGASSLIYTGVEISDEDSEALGLAETPRIAYNKLRIYPTRSGCARLKIKAIAGNSLPTDTTPGGLEIEKTVSVIAVVSPNSNGGWL